MEIKILTLKTQNMGTNTQTLINSVPINSVIRACTMFLMLFSKIMTLFKSTHFIICLSIAVHKNTCHLLFIPYSLAYFKIGIINLVAELPVIFPSSRRNWDIVCIVSKQVPFEARFPFREIWQATNRA